jgi:hypothetical protein
VLYIESLLVFKRKGMLSGQLETLEKNANRVCSKLKAMSSLQFGDKWNTASSSPQKNTIMTAIIRTFWYWGEGVEMSIADFRSTLEEAFTLIYECIDKYPYYTQNEQNTITRIIVKLTDNVSNVKMAVVRQKGAYANIPNKESARSSLDELITYVDDTLDEVSVSVQDVGINQKIDKDFRARKHQIRNPVIIPTKSVEIIPLSRNNSAEPTVAPPPPKYPDLESEDYGEDLEF